MARRFYYGGQAVIEGVMMRGRRVITTAVRRSDGEIVVDIQSLPTISNTRARRIPLVRGIVVLIESMVLGIKSLLYSANVSVNEEGEEISGVAAGGMVAASVAVAVGAFAIAPLFLTRLLDVYISSAVVFNIIEGLIRMGLFIAYLGVLAKLPSMKRVFSYHGAEHKAVNAYEAGVPLEVAAAREYNKAHTRCGTSFLFVVMIIAIIALSLVGHPSIGYMVLWRIILVPVIAGISYEVTQFGARHIEHGFIRALLAPGLWLQKLTTREPDDSQLEVSLAALKKAIEVDQLEEPA
ncbi:MAG: DUF1385 domain-containing protein [Dehalococcoidales bacterium]|nr:DUF1385 domain-containing protein [Dehalococcoidales bacterium]